MTEANDTGGGGLSNEAGDRSRNGDVQLGKPLPAHILLALSVDPAADPLRQDPRFDELMKKLGLQ